jgi:RNA polymerase sigma factor (sigma-70 family)
MNNSSTPTHNDFELLLAWLSNDREVAGELYEKIRQGLIRFFYFKGCRNGEDLADETISRVTKKLTSLDLSTETKPAAIFYGFAKNIVFEEFKKEKREGLLDENIAATNQTYKETNFRCLDNCLLELPQTERDIVTRYYSRDKSEKYDQRRELASEYGISIELMYVKLHRIRKRLRVCIENCSEK